MPWTLTSLAHAGVFSAWSARHHTRREHEQRL